MLEAECGLTICGSNFIEREWKQKCVPFVIATDRKFCTYSRVHAAYPVFSCRKSCASRDKLEWNAHDDRIGILSTGTNSNSKYARQHKYSCHIRLLHEFSLFISVDSFIRDNCVRVGFIPYPRRTRFGHLHYM